MIPEELLDQWEEGHFEESHVVMIIKTYFRSEQDKKFLNDNDLSLEDILNGRFTMGIEAEILSMFERWNKKCGRDLFGF